MEEERRWKRRGRGNTVQQLFTEVLSSYFTRKHSHSYLNSPTGQSPTPSVSHSCRCLLHFLPFILTLWMEMPPEPSNLSPPICWFLSQREQKLDPCHNENNNIPKIQELRWSHPVASLEQTNTNNKRFNRTKFLIFPLCPSWHNDLCKHTYFNRHLESLCESQKFFPQSKETSIIHVCLL